MEIDWTSASSNNHVRCHFRSVRRQHSGNASISAATTYPHPTAAHLNPFPRRSQKHDLIPTIHTGTGRRILLHLLNRLREIHALSNGGLDLNEVLEGLVRRLVANGGEIDVVRSDTVISL